MKFVNEDIRLLIKQKDEPKNSFKFKAYLEKSDVQVKLIDTNLQYAPLNFTNNTQLIKTQYSVDFSFNVFAEDENEAKTNYVQLHDLLATIKPSYTRISGQLIPNSTNIFGLITLKFRGLPRLSRTKTDLDIYVTNFTYEINKDMGFFDTQLSDLVNKNQAENLLTPIAYKVGIAGRVLLPLDEAVNITNVIYNSTTGVAAAEPARQPTQAPAQQETLQPAAPADAPKESIAITDNKKPAGGNKVKKKGGPKRKTTREAFLEAGGKNSEFDRYYALAAFFGLQDTTKYENKVKVFTIILSNEADGYIYPNEPGGLPPKGSQKNIYDKYEVAANEIKQVTKKT